MNKLILLGWISIIFLLISCEPVKIVSAKYNGSDAIPFPYGNMKMIAVTTNNRNFDILFNYLFADTIIFRPDIYTVLRDTVISKFWHVPYSNNDEYFLHGDDIMRISMFRCPRVEVAVSDTFFIQISGFFDKRNNPLLIDPIEYYIEDEVNYNPFRDGERDYVSSKKKIDEKKGYIIFDDGSKRTYR